MSPRTRRMLALGAAFAFVFSACQSAATTAPSGSASTAPSESASAAPATPSASAGNASDVAFKTDYPTRVKQGTPGGTVILAEWQQVDTLNPFYAGAATDNEAFTLFFSTLTTVTDDGKFVPDAAVEIPTLENGGVKVPGDNGDAMTVTWKLRNDIKWSDGTPLTCDDVAYTQQWVMDPENSGLYTGTVGWEDITKTDCPDPYTAVQHWKNVYEGYYALYQGVGILPKAYMSKIPIKDAASKSYPLTNDIAKVPTSGPFKPMTIAKDLSEIDYVKNPAYMSNPAWGPSHAPYLDKIIFKYYSDADAMIAGYKAGEYDVAMDLNDADLPKLTDLQAQGQVLAKVGLTYELLRPNWASKVMGDPAMRQALLYAVDKNAINQRLLGGNAQIAYTFVSPIMWYFNPNVPQANQDLAKANSILDAAGWAKGADGIRAKGGVTANIQLCTTTRQVRQDTLALVAGWLKEVGIAAKVVPVQSSVIFGSYTGTAPDTNCNLAHGTFDVAEHAFVPSPDPLTSYVTYYSKTVEPKGSNDAKVNDPAIDKAFDAVKGSVDFSVIKQSMFDVQDAYVASTAEVPLYYRKDVYIVSPKVQNFVGNPSTSSPQWNAQDWFLTQ